MRTKNLKYISVALFAIAFIVGGFFISAQKASASDAPQPYSYSLSSVASYANNVGGVTTVVQIGCFPGSGDKYDINTGKVCSYITSGPRIGCAIGSGDKYDINTGKICLYLTSKVIIGCASNSTDKYDINTGKLCINNISILTVTNTTVNPPSNLTINEVNNDTTITEKIAQRLTKTKADVNSILKDEAESLKTPIGENIDKNNLTASARGIRGIFTWPMSTRGITILIVIILAIAYGIYSLVRKDTSDDMPLYVEPKEKSKEVVKPIITSPQSASHTQTPQVNTGQAPKPQEKPLATVPQANTSNPQMPLNISGNQNTPGQPLQK